MQANIVFFKQEELDVSLVSTGTFIYVWNSTDITKKLGFKTREGTLQWIALGTEEIPTVETTEPQTVIEKAIETSSTA